MIRGIDVVLHEKTQSGADPFGRPICTETAVTVGNVLVTPVSAEDAIEELNLSGKRLEYILCIPKGDAHVWEDSVVEFFGKAWKTFGGVQQWMEEMVPLFWNKKVKVERYE